MEKKPLSGTRWQYGQWEEHHLQPSTLSGKTIPRPLRSSDTRSPGYPQTQQRIQYVTWHDVYPFSMAIWPYQFADNLRSGSWWLRRNNYPNIAVELILEGELQCEIGGESRVLVPGDLLLTHPGDTLALRSTEHRRSRELQLCISGGTLPLLLESLGLVRCRFFHFDVPDEIERLLRGIAELLESKRSEDARANSRAGYDLLLFFTEHAPPRQNTEQPPLLTQALQSMESCRGLRMSVAQLAVELGVCRTTLSRLFRQYLDTSPRQYWERLRLESARQMVANGELPFKEIAEQLGFASPFYFSTVFRRATGRSPSEFRAAAGARTQLSREKLR